MRSAAFVSLLSLATIFACANSHYTGFPDDGGAQADSGKVKANADDSGTTEEPDDAGKDTGKKPPKDTGTTDPGCAPGSVSGFTPQWTPPAVLHAGACSATQITTLIDCLFNSAANQTTCDGYLNAPANKSCISCAVTEDTAASYGPLVVTTDQLVTLNIAGCIARTTNQMTDTGCGAKVQAASQCASASCEANCPVPANDSAALDARNQCEQDARTSECQTYTDDAACEDAALQGAAAACASGSTFEDNATALVQMFCGN
jgi:hypothetical protein